MLNEIFSIIAIKKRPVVKLERFCDPRPCGMPDFDFFFLIFYLAVDVWI